MYAQAPGRRNFSKIERGTDGAPMDGVSAIAQLSRVRLVQPRLKACLLLKLEFTNEPKLLEDGGISWFVCAREKRPLGKVCVLVSLRVLSILPWDERTVTSGGTLPTRGRLFMFMWELEVAHLGADWGVSLSGTS